MNHGQSCLLHAQTSFVQFCFDKEKWRGPKAFFEKSSGVLDTRADNAAPNRLPLEINDNYFPVFSKFILVITL